MFSQFSYPIICAENFAKTVSFYEDHLKFELAFEVPGFTVLKRTDWPDMYFAVIDSQHDAIPEQYRKGAQGMILNYPVSNVQFAYDAFYMEGLNILSEPEDAICGRRHFYVEDPNGILINVAENVPLESVLSEEKIKEECFVA